MTQKWTLVLGGDGQIMGDPTHDLTAMKSIKLQLDPVLRTTWFVGDLPFQWISIVIAYDAYEDLRPIYRRISKKYGDLPLVIRMKMSDVCDSDPVKVESQMMRGVLTALIHVAAKYDLPDGELRGRLEALDKSAAEREQEAE